MTRSNARNGAVLNDETPILPASDIEAEGGRAPEESDQGVSVPLVGAQGTVFRPLRELGEGGMARVYLAYAQGSNGFGKLVVLKVMREAQDDEAAREMFLEEARLSARLNHPNIVQVYEVVHTAEFPYMVMEYLEGKPLSKIRIGEHITQSMVMTILCETLVGLHHAHELRDFDGKSLNIVHRDVSPQNVFVTYDGVVKVLDFGIAKTETAVARTEAGQIRGKLAYMAPEQLLGEKLDRRADVFAVGAMLWETAVGARLWENVSQANLMHRLATGDIPKPSERGSIDPELEAIILKAMAPDPEHRYATALEMQKALEAYRRRAFGACSTRAVGTALAATFAHEREENRNVIAQALHESVPPPSLDINAVLFSNPPPPEPPPRRSPMPWVIAGVIAVLGVGGFLLRPQRQAPAPTPAATVAPQSSSARLVVRTTPNDAHIIIDGQDRGAGSAVLDVPRGRDHEIRLSAPGHVPEQRVLRIDSDQELNVTLAPINSPTNPVQKREQDEPAVTENKRALAPRAPVGIKPRSAPEPAAKPALPAPATPDKSCDPPYYFKDGIKTYKPECL